MMKVSFAEVDETYIRNKVDDGYYSSVTEVIRDAVRRLRESETGQSRLLSALEQGERSIQQGRHSPFTSETMGEIKERALKRLENGETATRRDVTPH